MFVSKGEEIWNVMLIGSLSECWNVWRRVKIVRRDFVWIGRRNLVCWIGRSMIVVIVNGVVCLKCCCKKD